MKFLYCFASLFVLKIKIYERSDFNIQMLRIQLTTIMERCWVLVFLLLHVSAQLTVYQNAKFTPVDPYLSFSNLSSTVSRNNCACYCFQHPMCLIAIHSALFNRCSLSSARLDQGVLQIATTAQMNSVLIFGNKTLTGNLLLHLLFSLRGREKSRETSHLCRI